MRILIGIGGVVALGLCALLAVHLAMPRMNWSAAAKPSHFETLMADSVRERWIKLHSVDRKNPFAPTPENLSEGRDEYNAHCATCHALDGSGTHGLDATFYPRVAALTGDTQEMSDSEIYFVIANGVALSAMPAFGEHHSSQELWKLVLWVRRLANLPPDERKKIERETSEQERSHQEMMRHAGEAHEH